MDRAEPAGGSCLLRARDILPDGVGEHQQQGNRCLAGIGPACGAQTRGLLLAFTFTVLFLLLKSA